MYIGSQAQQVENQSQGMAQQTLELDRMPKDGSDGVPSGWG